MHTIKMSILIDSFNKIRAGIKWLNLKCSWCALVNLSSFCSVDLPSKNKKKN